MNGKQKPHAFARMFAGLLLAAFLLTAAGPLSTAKPSGSGGGGPPACNDGVDNDGDGKTDYPADPGCSSKKDNDESSAAPPAAACNDGVDNDGDGAIDYPADPGCASRSDTDEYNAPPARTYTVSWIGGSCGQEVWVAGTPAANVVSGEVPVQGADLGRSIRMEVTIAPTLRDGFIVLSWLPEGSVSPIMLEAGQGPTHTFVRGSDSPGTYILSDCSDSTTSNAVVTVG